MKDISIVIYKQIFLYNAKKNNNIAIIFLIYKAYIHALLV